MSQHGLMSEDEVLEYFIANGGVVRNNDIVTFFRTYLANPAIRDEARALFKVIVNKLATVKVENGEKFLVLKRQFFLPIDGNGNPPPIERRSSAGHGLGLPLPLPSPFAGGHAIGLPLSPSAQNFTPFPYQAPPPYVSNGAYPNLNTAQIFQGAQSTPSPQNFSTSQPQLYGSQSSLMDQSQPPTFNRSPDYEYGLPPPPKPTQRRLSLSSPSSSTGGSPAKLIPPPYRPPPPAPNQNTPSPPALPTQQKMMNFRSPVPSLPLMQQQYHSQGHPSPQRSLSVSGLNTTPKLAPGLFKEGSHSASPSSEHTPFFPAVSQSPSSSPSANIISPPPPPVPPRAKRSSSFYEKYPAMEELLSSPDKENENGDPDIDATAKSNTEKISVKERMQKFNKINSETDLNPKLPNGNARSKREANGKQFDSGEYDTSSLSSYSYGYAPEPKSREWILKAARCDYAGINKMAQETPTLVKRKDINGYTALHWAAKHGHADLVKLLAGTFKSDVNAKSNGGYTPLHLAAQFSRQDVYDVLVQVYNADPNLRDHSGKKPMQYLVRQDTSVSVDTFKKLKEKRRSTEQNRDRDSLIANSFLRIGSLNVRVKKTTEAFGNFLGKSNSSSQIERMIHKKWGSAESLPETEMGKDKEMMPPPSGTSVYRSGGSTSSKGKRQKSRKNLFNPPLSPSQQHRSTVNVGENTTINEGESGSESDTACGFGSQWKSP